MKNLNGKFTCNLEIYYFYSDFLSTAWKMAKKMAEKEGFEPSIILLVKSRLKRCFIPPFERKFLKF